jgi:DNA-binding FadR family transcriptional regulator
MHTRSSSGEPMRLHLDGTWSRRPGRFASVVVEELGRQIISGRLATGVVLPTEPVLCEEFGFSRTVIREGVKLLEERGLVRVEQGRGTTVQSRDAWNLLDPVVIRIALEYDADMSLLDSLMSVRRVLEREMARDAATRLTDDELAALRNNLEQTEASVAEYGAETSPGNFERFRSFDSAFHTVIMRASGNEVGLSIVRAIHRHGGVRPPLAQASDRASLERTAAEHRAIYNALAARDGDLAGELIASHIEGAWAERRDIGRSPLDNS